MSLPILSYMYAALTNKINNRIPGKSIVSQQFIYLSCINCRLMEPMHMNIINSIDDVSGVSTEHADAGETLVDLQNIEI